MKYFKDHHGVWVFTEYRWPFDWGFCLGRFKVRVFFRWNGGQHE